MSSWQVVLILVFVLSPLAGAENRFDTDSVPGHLRSEIFQRFPSLASDQDISRAKLDELIRFLASTGRYRKVFLKARDAGPDRIFTLDLIPNQEIKTIRFSGNIAVSDTDLLNRMELSVGDYFQPQDMAFAKESLLQAYQSRAYLEPKIELKTQSSGPSGIHLIFEISEGPRSKIASIMLRSENVNLNSELERLVKNYRGEAITDPNLAELREDMTDYLRKHGYYQATLQGPRITRLKGVDAQLIYNLSHPTRYNISLRGNKSLSTSHLIASLDLEKFFSPNPAITDELENRLEQYYLERGFAHVEVKGRIEERSEKFVRAMVFHIQEGPQVKISDFEVKGSVSRPKDYYTDIVLEEATPLIRSGFYNRGEIEEALGALVIRLQNEGYLQAKVIALRAEYSEDKSNVNLALNLNEGPLTHVQEIVFQGNTSLSDRELRQLIQLEGGQPLRLNFLEEGIEKIKAYYHDQGFLEASIKNEKKDIVRYNADQTLAQIVFVLDEGPKVIVNDIIIEGNDFTKDYVIHYELEFEKGDILTPEKLEESLRRLQRVGYFSSVDIKMLEAGTPIAERTIVVTVTERAPGLLNFGLGVTNERDFTLRGYTGLAYRNIQGTGRALTARLDGKYNVAFLQYPEYQVSAGYFEPYLFDSRVSGRINLITREEITDFFADENQNRLDIRARKTDEITLSLEKNITSNILFRWNLWEFSSSQEFTIGDQDLSNRTNIASLGPYLDVDFRDHPFNPTSGSRWLLTAKYSHPVLGSTDTIEFARATGSYTNYWNVYGSLVWANSLGTGYLKNLSDRPLGGVPYHIEGFYLGGANTIRGFDFKNERFPLPRELTLNPETDYRLTDESTFYLIKSELRFPIYGFLAGAVFFDGGQVIITDVGSLYESDFRSSVGIAIRFITPVGAINFEWGIKSRPRNERGEDPSHLHFSIGTF